MYKPFAHDEHWVLSHLRQFSEHLLPNSGEAKKPIYFSINKSNLRIKIPKQFLYDIRKGRKDAFHYIDFIDK